MKRLRPFLLVVLALAVFYTARPVPTTRAALPIVTRHTSAGTYTWAKDPNATLVEIWFIGPGAGGGAGRRGAAATNRGGGGAGGNGAICHVILPASAFSSRETIFLGRGGLGGNGNSVAGVNDTNGVAGDASADAASFMTISNFLVGATTSQFKVNNAGAGGGGGTTSGGAGGTHGTALTCSFSSVNTGTAGAGGTAAGVAGGNTTLGHDAVGSSGGAGGISSGGTQGPGGNGISVPLSAIAGTPWLVVPGSAAVAGLAGTSPGGNGGDAALGPILFGTGAGGGAGSSVGDAGRGGNGICGSGGGGGGGSLNDVGRAGKGGDGGSACIMIVQR